MFNLTNSFTFKSLFILFFLTTSQLISQPQTALEFNGISSYVNCGNSLVFTPENQITVSAWINTNTEYLWQTVIWRSNVVINYYGIKITPEGKVRGTLFLDGFYHIFSKTTIRKNEWYHIAITYNNSLPEKNFKIYINGNLDAELNAVGTIKWHETPLWIGKYPWYGAFQIFKGFISNVQIWSRALNGQEIKQKMNISLDARQEDGLAAYWPISELKGDTLYDHSTNGNNGTIVDCEWFPKNPLIAKITLDNTLWQDTDYNGFEAGTVNGSSSIGEITSYTWILNNDTISTTISPKVEVPSGTNLLKLTVKSKNGFYSTDSVYIEVYCAEFLTNGPIYSAPSQLNNSLFISSFDDKVYKFDSTGSAKWTFLTGGDILSTATVVDEDNIFVSSSDTRLYSFNSSGIPNWDKAMGGVIVSSPAVSEKEKSIYTGLTSGRLFAVSFKGEIDWSYQANGSLSSSAVIGGQGTIYFGCEDKNLYAVDRYGVLLWKFITTDMIKSSPAIGIDSTVIISSTDGFVYKINQRGQLVWKFYTSDTIYASPVIGQTGNIYVGSTSGWFYSISKDGDLNWKYSTHAAIKSTASISFDGSTIYFGNDSGNIYALTNTGKKKWVLETEASITAPTLVTDNNIVYAGSTNGKVYIIKDNPYDQTSELPVLEWPTYQGNNQRTGERYDIATSVLKRESLPESYSLQNYPNPFNPSTNIKYSLVSESKVQIRIHNSLGEIIEYFEPEIRSAGNYNREWNAGSHPTGIYFCTITAFPVDGQQPVIKTIKMLLLK